MADEASPSVDIVVQTFIIPMGNAILKNLHEKLTDIDDILACVERIVIPEFVDNLVIFLATFLESSRRPSRDGLITYVTLCRSILREVLKEAQRNQSAEELWKICRALWIHSRDELNAQEELDKGEARSE